MRNQSILWLTVQNTFVSVTETSWAPGRNLSVYSFSGITCTPCNAKDGLDASLHNGHTVFRSCRPKNVYGCGCSSVRKNDMQRDAGMHGARRCCDDGGDQVALLPSLRQRWCIYRLAIRQLK